jgi:hypothetical protein
MSVENTVDYLGYALSTTGTPLADRAVTLKRVDTSGTIASTVTDANGMWRFDDIAPSPLVRAEISAGTTPQIAVKSVYSGDVFSLYVREKFTAAPAAIVNLPPLANIYSNSVLLTATFDSRYVNVAGDTMTGELTVGGATNAFLSVASGVGGIPVVRLRNVEAPANSEYADLTVDTNGSLLIRAVNDAYGAASTWMTFARTGTTLGLITATAPVSIAGTLAISSNATVGGTLGVTGALTVSGGAGVASGLAVTSGQLKASDGTLAAPGSSFASDLDTGFWHSADGTMVWVSNGVAKITQSPTLTTIAGNLTVTGTLNAVVAGTTVIITGTYLGDASSNRDITIPGAPAGKQLTALQINAPNAHYFNAAYVSGISTAFYMSTAGNTPAQNTIQITGAATFRLNAAGAGSQANINSVNYYYVATFA